ncbi:Nitrogen permease regulator-like 3 [Mortierella sp. GBA30]|nr:Nitrogen permease regulator-like 3 [Mortierella sp. GBA30]
MNGLVGIIIVTNSSRGHHFVYKYPQETQRSSQHGRPSHRHDSKTKHELQQVDEFQATSKVLGYDPQFLANLLSPKLALCDKRFQLTVDDLTFIGHPVSLGGPEFRQRRDYWKWKSSRPPKERAKHGWIVGGTAPFMDDSGSDSEIYDEDSNDESNPVRGGSANVKGQRESKEARLRRGSKDEAPEMNARSFTDPTVWRQQRFRTQTYASNPSSPASGDSPVGGQTPQQQMTPSLSHQSSFGSSLLHHPVSLPQTPTGGIQNNFVSHLAMPPPIQITQGAAPTLHSHLAVTPSSHFQHMSFFHVVFVLKPQELQLNAVADQVYKNIACKLTAALRYEELNSQYVSQEATKIIAIREEAAQAAFTLEQFHEQVLATSSLARAIRSIYECIFGDKVCHVVLNDSIDISLQIPHLAPLARTGAYISRQVQSCVDNDGAPSSNNASGCSQPGPQQSLMTPMAVHYGGVGGMGYMMDDYEIGIAYEYENFPVLYPYHTLLLLEDPEEILKDIPLDANPTLVKLVQILVPYQCLDELQYILDCSMAQIYRLASHLIYWRKAKLIDQIRVSNVYVVAPQAGISEYADFSQHFPTLSLPNILHELSTPKAYKAHIPGAGKDKEVQTLYLEMLTYLLRKDLIVQLHTYILIMVPEYIKLGCTVEEYEHMMIEDFGAHSGALTPTLESPTVSHHHGTSASTTTIVGGGQGGSAKSVDFGQLTLLQLQQQQQQQLLMFPKQQILPSQTYRYHNRSSTGPGGQGPVSAGAGISSSLKSHMSMPPFGKLLGKRQDASSILPNPGQASEAEREWLVRMCDNQPQSVTELFMRLIHYFDGQHHVEEILFREQIVAKDLKTVLSAFREFLILTWA